MIYIIENDHVINADKNSAIYQRIKNKIEVVKNYEYDKFRFFPSKHLNGWGKYFEYHLLNNLNDPEIFTFYLEKNDVPFLIGYKVSKWDEDVFGFRIANSNLSFLPEIDNSRDIIFNLFSHSKNILSKNFVKFINLRLHGDNLNALHAAEDIGFRYYENIIWPYTECRHLPVEEKNVNLRLMRDNELERLLFIASNFQYKRSHYYCDRKFNPNTINNLHVKWLNSYREQKNPIVIVEIDDELAGYIVLRGIDEKIQHFFGYKVGQLSSMAIDPKYRGKGLGKHLIRGGINILTDMGAEFVDTGLATKNIYSSSSIRIADFKNYYEEVTFHLWI